ncbi:DsrE family protein [Sulfuricurvum sp.]|uniref:DsrE family protein n=1 Tax=Sulfuricurvum sp. TaxID=2025608 RepID=UPI003565B65F
MNLKMLMTGMLGMMLAISSAEAGGCNTDAPKSMVITITEGSIVKAGFGLAVANAMQDAGVQSTVFIAADAVNFALNKGTQPKFAGATPKELMTGLIRKGGHVKICEGFVKLGGIKKSDIVEGVEIAAPADLAGALYAPNAQSMTF